MDPRARSLLYDVQQAGDLLENFTTDKSFDDYAAEPLLRSAVERQLEIIGEALNQLAKIGPSEVAEVTNYRRIIALRNVLIHGYARIDHRVIWNVLQQSLPTLRREIAALMAEP